MKSHVPVITSVSIRGELKAGFRPTDRHLVRWNKQIKDSFARSGTFVRHVASTFVDPGPSFTVDTGYVRSVWLSN
jgi:hypothetical protein